MVKNPPSHEQRDLKSQHSTKPLLRRPIHERIKEYEEEDYEEDEEEIHMSLYPNYNKLYPDLKEDLKRVKQQNKSFDTEKKSNKSKQSVKSEKTAYETSSSSYETSSSSFFKIIIYILLFILSIVFYFISYGGHMKTTTGINVAELVADIQNHFKEQQSETFRVLKSALKHVVNDKEPSAPAIFTVVANKGAENTAADFSMYVAKVLASERYVLINESAHWYNDPDGLKLKIDNEIKSKLENKILNVVIVDRLHNIPIDAAMIFHGYCDHENASYKRAVYLFIVHLNGSIVENSDSKYLDAVAMKNLKKIWWSSTDDFVDSLITRLTVNVVNIR